MEINTMIREAREDDLKAINDIYNQAVLQGMQTADTEIISLETRKNWFINHDLQNYPVFIYENENEVVAWISLSAYRPGRKALKTLAEISYYVHSDYQGKGIGTKLMEYALNIAPSYGFRNLVAILLGLNNRSIGLLEKFGFSKWGLLPDVAIFDNKTTDHLYYGLKLKR